MVERARITSKKQLTLPAKLFQAAGLKEGQEVSLTLENGRIILTSAEQLVTHLSGSLQNNVLPQWSGKDIDSIIAAARKTYFRHYYRKL